MSRYASSSTAVGVLPSTEAPELDWELLYDLHADLLRRVIQRKVGPAHTEDVLQETFLRAFRNRHTIDPHRPLVPWLITIALRASADHRRRQLRRVTSAIGDETWEETGFSRVEEELVRKAKQLGIKHALASLTTRQRRILEAVAVEGVTYSELASSEALSPDALRGVVARARTNFRASYTGFTRGSGLFGGVVGTTVLKLRHRLQRYQQFIEGHATAFGAATVTVIAVGIAAYPMARPVATEAVDITNTTELVASSVGAATPRTVTNADIASVPVPVPSPAGGSAPRETSPVPNPSAGPIELDGRYTVGARDDVGHVGVGTETQAGEREYRSYGGAEVDCTRTTTGEIACAVIDLLPSPPLS